MLCMNCTRAPALAHRMGPRPAAELGAKPGRNLPAARGGRSGAPPTSKKKQRRPYGYWNGLPYGEMPDSVLADLIGETARDVTTARKSRGIPVFSFPCESCGQKRTTRGCSVALCRRAASNAARNLWRKLNPDQCREHRRAWRKLNPDQYREHKRAWYRKNRERVLAADRVRYRKNRERILAARRMRRATAAGRPPPRNLETHRDPRQKWGIWSDAKAEARRLRRDNNREQFRLSRRNERRRRARPSSNLIVLEAIYQARKEARR